MTLPWRYHRCVAGECGRVVGANSMYCCPPCGDAWRAEPRSEPAEHSAACVLTLDDPESCGVLAGTPCTDLDTTVTVHGVTRRAVHADRYAAGLPPAERGGYWRGLIERYYAEQDESTNPERKAAK